MSRIRFTLAVCALVAAVSACQDGGSVTGPDSSPGGGRYNLGWAGTGHFIESTDTVAGTNGIGMIGSGHYIDNGGMAGSGHYIEGEDGIGMAGSGHAIATNNGGMAGSGGESTMSDSVIVTLYGIGTGGSGH
jgi:hypothetical protein